MKDYHESLVDLNTRIAPILRRVKTRITRFENSALHDVNEEYFPVEDMETDDE